MRRRKGEVGGCLPLTKLSLIDRWAESGPCRGSTFNLNTRSREHRRIDLAVKHTPTFLTDPLLPFNPCSEIVPTENVYFVVVLEKGT